MKYLHTYIIFSLLLAIPKFGDAQSVLSSGSWYKIGIVESGVYKIDKAFLESLNINTNQIDPQTLKIYGHGGGMLPQENSAFSHLDPPQNKIFVSGESDGSFDNNDFLLFYGKSPHKSQLLANGQLDYEKNYYTDTTYYFLTFGDEQGERISNLPNATVGGSIFSTYHDFITEEDDEQNILSSGREWFSNPLTSSFGRSTEKVYAHNVPGIKDSVGIDISIYGASLFEASFDIYFNQRNIETIPVAPISSSTYTIRAIEYPRAYSIENNTSESFNLNIIFNENRVDGQTSQGLIDYVIFGFERDLKIYGNQSHFRNRKAINQNANYSIDKNGQSNLLIWNVTNPTNPANQRYAEGTERLTFNATNNQVTEYVIFNPANISAPSYFGTIRNQNLKSSVNVDGIIVTVPQFLAQAQRLAAFHATNDGLDIKIVTTREIYNEFSTGMQDISAIRNYFKYVWENGNEQLKYALLFGDCSYDYKQINKKSEIQVIRDLPNQNFIPVYESYESVHRLYSHPSDDYYGFFEEDEGDWYEGDQHPTGRPIEGTYNDHTLEIGIGRIPIRTATEAKNVVDKIIRYSTSPNTLGKWKNKFVYIADDGDRNQHMIDVEDLHQILSENYPRYDATRLYLDNFEQPNYTSPRMKIAIQEQIADGAFIIDYLGHGGARELMQENVIEKNLISQLNNRHKLPLFVTATCQFGVYDDPSLSSGAEDFLLSPNGGAIALLTTSRAVFAQTNFSVNKAFHESVFARDENGNYLRLGDIMRLTKNNSLNGPINRNFVLLGDPMLRLKYPKYDIKFEELEAEQDTLSALEEVRITGKVYDNETVVESFNGTATITLWDIPRQKITLGLDNPLFNNLAFESNEPFTYMEQDNALFRGEANVINGVFSLTFTLPKNASYQFKKGRITAYAFNREDIIDASGASQNFLIGGSADLKIDQTPPTIVDTYINEPSFRNGDVVGPSSLFIAKLSDENGINISTNGFNQNLTLTLNDTLTIELNDFYTAETDNSTAGTIVYPIQNFPKGTYTGQLKVWDTYNNSSTKYVEFKVSDKPKLRLYNVGNYPNPTTFDGETTFRFEHDKAGEQLLIKIVLFDQMGGKVNKWVYELDDVGNQVNDLTQLMVNYNGDRLKKGLYFYKLQVTSTTDGATNEVISRLLIN